MRRRRLLIIGAGGHGQVVASVLMNGASAHGGRWDGAELAFLDDTPELAGQTVFGIRVVGRTEDIPSLAHDAVVVGIGDNRARADMLRALERYNIISAVHASAVVDASAEIGAGVVVCAGSIVNPLARLGDGVILNTGCSVDHHNRIGRCAHVAPGAHLAGGVTVEEGALIGVGASVAPRVTVGAWAVVGAGAAVVSDIEPGATVVGVPARPVARRDTCE